MEPAPKIKPAAQTLEEPKYLKRLIEDKARVSIRLLNGQEYEGVLEYYDATFVRLTRDGAPNLFIFKQDIKYIAELNG